MIIVLGSARVREDATDEAFTISQAHVQRSRTEAGCVSHAVYWDPEQPRRLVFVEQWADREALWAHFQVPASRTFAKALGSLAVEPPEMSLFESTPLPIPGRGQGG